MESLEGWRPVDGDQLEGRYGDAGVLGPWIETDEGIRYAIPAETAGQLKRLNPMTGDRLNISYRGGRFLVVVVG